MFTSYIKSLNDMVFTTSDSPEEQPSTGVLGRIGSWFSPWKGKNPNSPTENASPSSDQVPQLVGKEDSKESVSLPAEPQQWDEEKDLSSNPNPLGLSRDSFLCEEKDATQSARRHDSAVSSAEAREGGPKEEGFGSRKKKTGQSKEWEGSSNGTSQSRNPERNASHLTHHFSTKQSADRAHALPQAERQVQAQAGKQLHVYLEETSVIHCGQDTCAGQEVVCTKVTKSLQVLPKSRSPPSSDLSSTSAENKRINVTPDASSYYSALVGVSLKSHKDSQSEPEPDKEQTEAGGMGRKNAARRRYRKNSQGDGGNSPQEKMSPTTQSVTEGVPSSDNSVDSPLGKSPKAHMGGSTENSSSEHNLTSQVSPGGGEEKTSCPDTGKELDNFQNSNSVIEDSLARVVEGGTDMEDDDRLYRVERKTETPESKRRSIKVSRSEVKLFRKYVPLKPVQSSAEDSQDFTAKLKNDKEAEKEEPQTKPDGRLCDLKKTDEEPKAAIGRIADKISLFERQQVEGGLKRTFRTPRSADVSPARTATERLKADCEFQRSRSAERHGAAGSSSVLLGGEKPLTIRERLRNLTEASKSEGKSAPPQRPVMIGTPKKSTTSVAADASSLRKLERPGKLDTNEQAKTTAMSEQALKPDGQDTTSVEVNVSTSKEQTTDAVTKITDDMTLKPEDQGTKPDNAESSVSAKGASESSETSSNISLQSKGPSRTGSRSKRRKSKEYTSPVSPNNENKPTSKQEVAALKQERVGDKEISLSASKRPSEKPLMSETKQKVLKKEVFEKQKKGFDFSFIEKNIDKPEERKEGPPKSFVGRDEPDNAACSSGTKKPIDQDPAILPQQEEKAGGYSLTSTQQKEKTSNECKGNSAISPTIAAEQPIQRTLPEEQESHVEHVILEKEALEPPESGGNGKSRQQPQNKDTEPVNTAESKDVERKEKAGSEKGNQTEEKDKEKPQQLLHSDKNTNKSQGSDGEQGFSGTQASVAEGVESKNAEKKEVTRPIKDTAKTKENQEEPVSQTSAVISGPALVDLPVQTEHVSQTAANTTLPDIAAVCAVTETNEAVSCSERDKAPSKGEKAAERSLELKTKSAEICGTEADPVAVSAKPQCNSVPVEKVENSPDDSLTHGANDVEFPSSKPIIKATAAAEEVSVKAANDSPGLINLQTENMSAKEHSANSVSTSANHQEEDDGHKSSTVKSVSSEDIISEDRTGQAPSPLHSPTAEIAHSTPIREDFKFSDHVTAVSSPLPNELPPVPNGDISPHSQLQHTVKNETVGNKPSQMPKAATSSDANKLVPESVPHSAMKRLHFPRGLSKDDLTKHQDAPSSWLDVDVPRRKLKFPEAKLTSSGSESNILDASDELDDDDFVEKIKKLCAPFSLPPRKHNHLRPPQPPFAMPAIREDRFEKTFDPDEFKFGLRKKKFALDTTPSALAKLQSTEAKSGLKPARASLADRSLLLGSLDTDAWLKDKTLVKDEVDAKEEMDDNIRVKSRLEGSCVLSSLTSSSFRGKRNGVQTQAEGISSGEVSPSRTPQLSPTLLSQPPLPSPTTTAPIKDTLANEGSVLNDKEEARAAEAVASDSGPPFPSFNDIKLPDYLEKYLIREPAKPVQSTQEQERVNEKVTEKMTTPAAPDGEVILAGKPSPLLPDTVPPCFPEIPPTTHTAMPEQPGPQPQGTLSNHVRTARGFHKRPGKMVLFEKAEFGGQAYEIYRDVADATSMQFSPVISVKVIRGCWVLYEKPDFQGRTIALEEGGIELNNMWSEAGLETELQDMPPMQIGSIRLAVWDYSLPHIDLFTEPEGHGRVSAYHDDTIETGSFGIPLSTASIQVHSGVWLVFSDPGFQGMIAVLETGAYPFPETWGFPSPFVGSLRPLKMGMLKVENPNEVKAVIYGKPGFEGAFAEIDSEVFNFRDSEGGDVSLNLDSVGSLKIIGGLWVGYSQPGFEGQQLILEEGEYVDCSDWGGLELLSMRPILADFMTPHLKMFSDRDFGNLGVNIDLTVPVINMDDTGYGMKTQSANVISGVWVVFEEPGFGGEAYILEKGLYGSPEDWGALQPRIASAMPVMQDDFENTAKFKVQLFSEPGFQGSVLNLEDSVASLPDALSLASCKVVSGSWMAFEGQDFTGRMYVLEAGSYPDLRAMGCVDSSSSIMSLQTVGFDFSLPSITLFERSGMRGKRVVLTDGSVNLQLAGGCSRVQSVHVEGGMWVLYEGINYLGAQILLKPGDISDWHKFSSWNKIGSLRPLIQKQVHFRVRNMHTGLMMSVTGDLDDIKLLRIQEMEETGGFEQIWFYQNGYLHCKLLEECCLCPSSTVTMAGGRVGLTPLQDNPTHLWSITTEGFIRYTPTANLVLEVKGGHHFDKNQVILSSLDPNKPQQRWDVEII